MKHFLHVGAIDPTPLMLALTRNPGLWDRHLYRTTFEGTPFRGMNDVLLRYSRPEKHHGIADPMALIDDTDLVFYPAWSELPDVHDVVFNLMRRFRAIRLDRVIIARLPAGGVIQPHADDYGAYAMRDDVMRFHVSLQGLPGCLFHCGGETIQMLTGGVWWFQHRQVHAVENNSADERIHLLIDVVTA